MIRVSGKTFHVRFIQKLNLFHRFSHAWSTIFGQRHFKPTFGDDSYYRGYNTRVICTDGINQHTLTTIAQKQLGNKPACAWVKRDENRHGQLIKSRPEKMIKNRSFIPEQRFPKLLLSKTMIEKS